MEAGADIVQGGDNRCRSGNNINTGGSDNKGCQQKNGHVDGQEAKDGNHNFRGYFDLAYFDGVDGARVDKITQLQPGKFEKKENAHNFNAAAGGTGTAPDKHERHKQDFANRRPLVKICSAESSGGKNGYDLKESCPDIFNEGVKRIIIEICGEDGKNGKYGDTKIKAEFLTIPVGGKTAVYNALVMQGKVDAGQEHEHYDNRFNIYRIEIPDTGGMGGETTGGKGCKGMAQGIEKIYTAENKQQNFDKGEQQIYAPKDSGRILDSRGQAIFGRAGHFSLKKLHAAHAKQGKDGQ